MMYYTLMPSLEHIALAKISVTLWTQDDITAEIKFRNYGTVGPNRWQEIENKVKGKVSQFLLPELMTTKILNFVKLIGLEIIQWKQYHEKFLNIIAFDGKSLNRFHWTPQGTIDEKKTAEALIRDEDLDIPTRYILACVYCLDTNIPELWNKMSKNHRKDFYNKSPYKVWQLSLVIFWTYYINGEVTKVDNIIKRRRPRRCSFYQYAFEYATYDCNKVAIEYFLQKLTPWERVVSLSSCAKNIAEHYRSAGETSAIPRKYYGDALCFLLSQMNEEEQTDVFRNYPCEVLHCFLNWLRQNFFMEMAASLWEFFSEDNYYNILRSIADKVIDGHKDYAYEILFGEFWQRIPAVFKRYVVSRCINSFMLPTLLEIRDEKIIKSILEDVTVIEKMKFIFNGVGQCICEDLINDDNWDLLTFFIGKCISTRDEVMNIKKKVKDRKVRYCPTKEFPTINDKWDKFFQLFDDFISRYNKRKSVDEGDSNLAKKFHGTQK